MRIATTSEPISRSRAAELDECASAPCVNAGTCPPSRPPRDVPTLFDVLSVFIYVRAFYIRVMKYVSDKVRTRLTHFRLRRHVLRGSARVLVQLCMHARLQRLQLRAGRQRLRIGAVHERRCVQ